MITTVSLSATGNSAWVPVNHRQRPFGVALAVDLDSAASGITYNVQHTLDDLGKLAKIISITRSTTTVTVTFAEAHDANVNDSLVVWGTGITGMDGTFAVASVTNTTVLTYTSGTSATSTGATDTRVNILRVFPHEFLTGKTTVDDGNYAFPVTAVRLNVSAHSAGKATLQVIQGGA